MTPNTKTTKQAGILLPIFLGLLLIPKPAFAALPLIALGLGAGVVLDWAVGLTGIGTGVMQGIFAAIGTLLITLTGFLATLAGALFDALLHWSVVDLSGTLTRLGIADGIDLVWTAFRDLANILIIGMFVFIAISIILGISRYGDKYMIARVLLVAILINFSLLFTRIIIDSSNFVSGVFYRESLAAIGQNPGTGTSFTNQQGGQVTNAASGGIAAAFMGRAGITSLWKVWETFAQLFSTGRANNSALIVLAYALTISTFLVIASLVFLLGAFLMASRAILLVFVTITSSLAFATYLIPQLSESNYGWKGWWETLIQTALFGPLFTILLWASLVLLRAPKGSPNLSAFIQNPGDSNGWIAVIMYIFVIGFLFVSVKLAATFASKITGFSMAALAPALALGLGGRIAAFAGRQVLGRAAGGVATWAETRGTAVRRAGTGPDGKTPLSARAMGGWRPFITNRLQQAVYDTSTKAAKSTKDRDFNIAHTTFGGIVKEVAGLKGKQDKMFTGPDTKGYEGYEKRQAQKYAREGERIAMTKDEQKEFVDNLRKSILERPGNQQLRDDERDIKERMIQSTEELTRATEMSIEHTNNTAKSERKLREAERTYEDALARGTPDEINTALLERRNAQVEFERHNSDLEREKSRITQAQKAIRRDEGLLQKAVLDKLDAIAKREGILPEKFATAQEAAFGAARGRFTNMLRENMGIPLAEQNDTIAKRAVQEVKANKENKRVGRITDIMREHLQRTSPPPPPPPSGPGGTT